MDDILENVALDKESAHKKILNNRRRIKELRQAKHFCFVLSEGDSLDSPLFAWDDLSEKENIEEIKNCYLESVDLAEKFNTDLGVLFEYANLLRFNKHYLPAFKLFKKLENCYQKDKTTSSSDYFNLYIRMASCCEMVYGEMFAWEYTHKVWEPSLKLEECPSDKFTIISQSLFHTMDLDWRSGRIEDDFILLQKTLESMAQMNDSSLPAYKELKAIVIGYIAIFKIFQNEEENNNWSYTMTALKLFQDILGEGAGFKWTLEVLVCCERLAAMLRAQDAKGVSLMVTNVQYEILKEAANRDFSEYGPELFRVSDDLGAAWSDDDPNLAFEFYKKAIDIRVALASAGIKTFMRRRTDHSFTRAVLPPLGESFNKLISAGLKADCTLEEIDAEIMKYEHTIECLEDNR